MFGLKNMLECVFINNVIAKGCEPASPLEVSSSAAASGRRSPCTSHSSAGTTACPDTGSSRGSLGSTRATGLPGTWRSEQLRSRTQGTQYPQVLQLPRVGADGNHVSGDSVRLLWLLYTSSPLELKRQRYTCVQVRTDSYSLQWRHRASA